MNRHGFSAPLFFCVMVLGIFQPSFAAPETAAEAQPLFDIWEYRLEGNTLLATVTVEKALYPYLGPGLTIDTVQQAADNLERTYRDAGYPAVFVDIPVQDVVGGIVMLKVTEGRVGRVTVRDARYFTPSGIRAQMPSLQEGQALAVKDIQSDLRVLNSRSGDLKVAPVLKPGRSQGVIDVDIKVRDSKPLHGDVEYNNFNSADTTRSRLRTSLSYDNVWQKAHSFGLSYQLSPEDVDELNVVSSSYSVPLSEKLRLSAFAVKSETNVETAVDASVGGNSLTVIGDGEVAGFRLIRALPGSQKYSQSAVLGFDYKHFTEQVESAKLPIEYTTLSAQYGGTLIGDKSLLSVTLNATIGVRGLINDTEKFAAKRQGAEAGFFYLSGGLTRTDTLPADWQLVGRLRWQLSDAPLISNEQFSIGGFSSVRGYYESQVLGDRGYSAGFELRTPSLGQWLSDHINDARGLAFFDWGQVWIKESAPEQTGQYSLQGIGLGLRVQALDQLHLLWDVAWPLNDQRTIEQGDARTYLRFSYDF
jgi:hemolysin activation/secretion protein